MDEFVETALTDLPRDVIEVIVMRMTPKSVANLCLTSTRFAKVCRNEELWKRLMKLHYPDFDLTDNPRGQFVAIANGKVTKYEVREGDYLDSYGILGYQSHVFLTKDQNNFGLEIYGNPVPNGTQKWCVFSSYSEGKNSENTFKVYPDKQTAIQEGIDIAIDVYRRTYNDDSEYDPEPITEEIIVQKLSDRTNKNESYVWWQNYEDEAQLYSCQILLVTFHN